MELFGSNSSDEQLTGVRILRQFAVNEWYSDETLEKIIINVPVVESLGLLILKKLAKDHDNCGNLGNTRGFLPRIIDFMHVDQVLLWDENTDVTRSQVLETVVQLVKMLVSTTENTGKCLRREISEIVFTVSNGKDVLRHGSSRENWWNGGVLKELFNIFFKTYGDDGNQGCVRIAAGRLVEALEVPSIRVNVASL
ncbi:unnamed protein product [Brassica rapa]|uniref:Uncharacterized protein n=2 Tax=Brassica TaxID=3705 RepID=A0A3P5YLS4_BRACM|nr:unnamed protein product [Brassica napus]CAG7862781.1 unnamed protein product [Brassica rapa]VDC60938.1 unnamed protein product [Brassica rapa]